MLSVTTAGFPLPPIAYPATIIFQEYHNPIHITDYPF
jgi:hypothetical protein